MDRKIDRFNILPANPPSIVACASLFCACKPRNPPGTGSAGPGILFLELVSAHGLEIWLGRHPSGGFWHPADVKKSTRRGSPRRRQQCKLHNDFDSTIRYPAPHYSYWRIKTAQYTPYRYDELQVAALSSANPQPTRSNTPLEFLQPHHSSTLSENLDVLPT